MYHQTTNSPSRANTTENRHSPSNRGIDMSTNKSQTRGLDQDPSAGHLFTNYQRKVESVPANSSTNIIVESAVMRTEPNKQPKSRKRSHARNSSRASSQRSSKMKVRDSSLSKRSLKNLKASPIRVTAPGGKRSNSRNSLGSKAFARAPSPLYQSSAMKQLKK